MAGNNCDICQKELKFPPTGDQSNVNWQIPFLYEINRISYKYCSIDCSNIDIEKRKLASENK